jgi:hypothetical protein
MILKYHRWLVLMESPLVVVLKLPFLVIGELLLQPRSSVSQKSIWESSLAPVELSDYLDWSELKKL